MLVPMKPALTLAVALGGALLLIACGGESPESSPGTGQQVEGDATVTGEVVSSAQIAMPPKARVEVTLENISTDDPASIIIGRQSIADAQAPPIPFEVSYGSDAIEEDAAYAVKATIFKSDDPWMVNRETVQVITDGNPTSGVRIVVEPIP
jgi:putative lipoprotein